MSIHLNYIPNKNIVKVFMAADWVTTPPSLRDTSPHKGRQGWERNIVKRKDTQSLHRHTAVPLPSDKGGKEGEEIISRKKDARGILLIIRL